MKLKSLIKLILLLTAVAATVGAVIYFLNKDNFEDDFDDYFDEDELFDDEYIELETSQAENEASTIEEANATDEVSA